jgi:cell wall assembly regulator SMI1
MKPIQKFVIGVGIGGVVIFVLFVVTVEVLVQHSYFRFFYPLAPPMPPIVDQPMPEILAHLESVLKTNAPQVLATLQPGISSNQISQIEHQYHVQIPDDIQAIYEWHDGAFSTNYNFEFIPIHRFVPLEDMLAEKDGETKGTATATAAQRAASRVFAGYRDNWYCLFDDGSGNGYFFDPTRKPEQGAIFSVFVEDNEYTFFPSAKNLMAGVARCYEEGAYRVKPNSTPQQLQLDWDIDQSMKIWKKFGANNQQQ